QAYVSLLQQPRHSVACLGPEDAEGSVLRRHERELDAPETAGFEDRGRVQGKLVEGKRPRDPTGQREYDLAHRPTPDLVDQDAEALSSHVCSKGECAGD